MQRKHYALLALLAIALPLVGIATTASSAAHAPSSAKEVPYSDELAPGGKLNSEWTFIDNNNDGSTWRADGNSTSFPDGVSTGIFYRYNRNNDGDDWAITPAIHMEAGKAYKVSFYAHCSSPSYPESMSVYVGNGNNATALERGTQVVNLPSIATRSWTKYAGTFTVKADGDYYVGFQCNSDADQSSLFLCGVKVGYDVITPAAPTGLTVTPGANEALEATLTWTLPTTDDEGNALTAALDQVVVTRDGAQVATLDGTATSYTDATGLTSGFHAYGVYVVYNGVQSLAATARSPYIGPVAPIEITKAAPYSYDFEDATEYELWDVVTAEGSDAWTRTSTSTTEKYGMHLNKTDKPVDSWVFTPQFKLAAGAYKLSFYLASMSPLDVRIGTAKNTQAMTGVIVDSLSNTYTALNNINKNIRYTYSFVVSEAGDYYIGWHAGEQTTTTRAYVWLDNVKVEAEDVLPSQVTDLDVAPDENGAQQATLTWTNPSTTNVDGLALSSLTKAEVYRGADLVTTIENPVPGQQSTYTDKVATPGVYTYKVIVYNESGAADGTPLEVKSSWIGDATQQVPYSTAFSASDFKKWAVYDANRDGDTWKFSTSSSYGPYIEYKTKYSDAAVDDYLVSPPLSLAKGYYKLNYKLIAEGEHIQVLLGTKARDWSQATVLQDLNPASTPTRFTSPADSSLTFKVDAAGKYRVAFHYTGTVQVRNVTTCLWAAGVESYTPAPQAVDSAKVSQSPDFSLKAIISWNNPTMNALGYDLEDGDITKVVVYRGSEAIATLISGLEPGKQLSYADDAIAEAGNYTYTVVAYSGDAASEQATASAYIGTGEKVPYTAQFASGDGWTVIDASANATQAAPAEDGEGEGASASATWQLSGNSYYYASNDEQANDWLISPRIELPAGTYEITINAHKGENAPASVALDVTAGLNPAIAQLTDTIAAMQVASDQSQAYTFELNAGQAALYNIAIHAKQAGTVYIDGFTIAQPGATGIASVGKDAAAASFNGSQLRFATAPSRVDVFTASGALALSKRNPGNTVSLDALSHGAYIVSATVNGKKTVVKIIK